MGLPVSDGYAARLGQAADHTDALALDLHVARVDRRHGRVRWLETDPVLLLEIALQGGRAVVEERDDDVTVTRDALRLDDDVIAVLDVVIDHRFAPNAQHERVVLRAELGRQRHRLALVLVREDTATGGDLAIERGLDQGLRGPDHPREAQRARARRLLLEFAGLFELREVVVDGRGRGEPDGLRDLAHARRIPVLGGVRADEREDALSPLLILFRHAARLYRTHVRSVKRPLSSPPCPSTAPRCAIPRSITRSGRCGRSSSRSWHW